MALLWGADDRRRACSVVKTETHIIRKIRMVFTSLIEYIEKTTIDFVSSVCLSNQSNTSTYLEQKMNYFVNFLQHALLSDNLAVTLVFEFRFIFLSSQMRHYRFRIPNLNPVEGKWKSIISFRKYAQI